jgi:hypothetical protein
VGRAASVLTLCAGLGAYYVWSESLPDLSSWGDVAVLGLLVIPAVFALVYFALPLRRARHLLLWGVGVGLLAAALEILDFDVLANFAKLAAVTLLAFWFLSYFETAAWVVVVALIVPWVDAISVWRGPTKHIVTRQPELFTTFSFAFPVPGEANAAHLGLPDLMFFALFLGAADRWDLRTKLTWAAMALSFGATLALTVAFDIGGLPALPLLALGFLMPNADILWRRLRAENAWGSLKSERRTT